MAVFASIVSFFSIKKYVKDTRDENQKLIDNKIDAGVEKVIEHFNSKSEVINQKLHTTDTVLSRNTDEIESIQEDIKILEEDFKSLCQTIGKHEYIVDKIFPEYVDLRNSIQTFKHKVNENLVTKNEHVQRNREDDENQKWVLK